MAEQDMSDLFMYLTDENGNDVKGESSMQLALKDSFMTEFSDSEYDNYANFFDVTDFSFNLELADEESHGSSSGVPFADWYRHADPLTSFASGGRNQSATTTYKVKKIGGNLSKVVDSISPLFFQNCCYKRVFKKAILVKRAFTGGNTGQLINTGSQALGFLRIFMEDITITNIAWDDGNLLTEKLSFTCKHMQVKYKRQKDDGSLAGEETPIFDWKWEAGNPNQ